jgi:hypothetical protein
MIPPLSTVSCILWIFKAPLSSSSLR